MHTRARTRARARARIQAVEDAHMKYVSAQRVNVAEIEACIHQAVA
jgi:hypothetical protein